MRIIPAIDLIDGKCVRLSKGDYATRKIYNEDPVAVAREFEDQGIEYLHLVDLDGAKSRHIVNHRILRDIATRTQLKIDFGGGLKTDEDLRIAFENGASQVTGGSIAVQDPDTFLRWLGEHGPERIILGADARNEKIAVSGWQEDSGEALIPFIRKYLDHGVRYVICTDISKDGMLQGPAAQLYARIILETRATDSPLAGRSEGEQLKLIASGGISDIQDLHLLRAVGCEGAIIGKALYENRITLADLREFIDNI